MKNESSSPQLKHHCFFQHLYLEAKRRIITKPQREAQGVQRVKKKLVEIAKQYIAQPPNLAEHKKWVSSTEMAAQLQSPTETPE